MTSTILYVENGPDIKLPTRVEICPSCGGEGARDCFSNGMTAEEMHEQGEEFAEDYAAGMYSTVCGECEGENVIRVVDESQLDPETLTAWHHQEQEAADLRRADAQERSYCA